MYTPKLGWEETPGLGLVGNKARHTCTGRMYMYIGLYLGLYLHTYTSMNARTCTYNLYGQLASTS